MNLSFKRAIATSLPIALLVGSTIAASATPIGRQQFFPRYLLSQATGAATLGGGATLPIPAYLGKSVSGAYEASGTTSFGVAGSIFGYFASQSGGLNVEYCATGSGKGKGVFTGAANTVDIACSNAASGSTATTFGFLPPSGSLRQTYPTLAGTDAPLAQTDYTSYTSDHTSPQEPVELPSIFGAIAIIYHDNALSSSAARITLTDAQICGVYQGTITTFGKLLGNSDSTPIHPVYRADGSGTSFNFSNHLEKACGTSFGVNQTFTMADPKLPANTSLGETGNSGVISGVNATNGAIGYVETGYLTDSPSATGPMNYANVKNGTNSTAYDPFSGLPLAANSITSSSLVTNDAVNQTTSGPATLSALTGVRSGSCVKVVNPSGYSQPAKGYPILAVTYLLFNSTGNGSTGVTALRLLEKDLTTPALFKGGATGKITTVDDASDATGSTGYASLGSSFDTTIYSTATSCIGA